MFFQYNIQTLSPKTFEPTSIKLYISESSETDENGIEIKSIEAVSTQQISDGTITQTRLLKLPVSILQQMITGFDMAEGKPIVNITALNQFLSQPEYNIQIIP